jgi:alpha-L-fucosidase
MDEAEAAGSEMGRVATIIDINMQSVKKMTSADLVVAISPTGDGQVVVRKTDPNKTHLYGMKELLERANGRRQGLLPSRVLERKPEKRGEVRVEAQQRGELRMVWRCCKFPCFAR